MLNFRRLARREVLSKHLDEQLETVQSGKKAKYMKKEELKEAIQKQLEAKGLERETKNRIENRETKSAQKARRHLPCRRWNGRDWTMVWRKVLREIRNTQLYKSWSQKCVGGNVKKNVVDLLVIVFLQMSWIVLNVLSWKRNSCDCLTNLVVGNYIICREISPMMIVTWIQLLMEWIYSFNRTFILSKRFQKST